VVEKLLGAEGPVWCMSRFSSHWSVPEKRGRLLRLLQTVEEDPCISRYSANWHCQRDGRCVAVSTYGAGEPRPINIIHVMQFRKDQCGVGSLWIVEEIGELQHLCARMLLMGGAGRVSIPPIPK